MRPIPERPETPRTGKFELESELELEFEN